MTAYADHDGIRLPDGRLVYPGLHNSFAEEQQQPWWERRMFLLVLLLCSVFWLLLTVLVEWDSEAEDIIFSSNVFDFGDIRFKPPRRATPVIEIDEVFGNQYVKKEDLKNPLEELPRRALPGDAAAEGEGDDYGDAEDFAFMGSGVRPPRLLSQLKEYYPPEARSLGVTAELYLEIIIDQNGTVRQVTSYPDSVRLNRSLAPALEAKLKKEFQAAARKTLLGAKYTPVVRDGKAIAVRMGIPFQFRISG